MQQLCSSWSIAPKNERLDEFNPSLESNTGSCKLKLSNLKLVRLFVPSLAIFRMKSCCRLYSFGLHWSTVCNFKLCSFWLTILISHIYFRSWSKKLSASILCAYRWRWPSCWSLSTWEFFLCHIFETRSTLDIKMFCFWSDSTIDTTFWWWWNHTFHRTMSYVLCVVNRCVNQGVINKLIFHHIDCRSRFH